MNKKDIRVSAIVPIYNAERTLHRCIDSILKQTFSFDEIILINDGSTDQSTEICNAYSEKYSNCFVIHKKNEGVSAARNTGMDMASGTHIVFIDSDDYIDENYLECLVETAVKYPQCENIWCGFKSVNENGNVESTHLISDTEEYSIYTKKEYMQLSVKWFTQMPWHRLYRTSIIKDNKLKMNKDMSLAEDLLFNLEYLDACRYQHIVIVNSPVYNYVQFSAQSLNHKYRENLLEINTTIDNLTAEYLIKWNVDTVGMQLFYNQSFYRYEHVFDNIFCNQNGMNLRQKVRYVNCVLETAAFQKTLSMRTCPLNAAIEIAYRWQHYELVIVLRNMAEIKGRLFNK